jgi:SAM-dependent methyltransferase
MTMNPQELDAWFADVRGVLENAYLAHEEPWRQSGMSGPEGRWVSLRKPVADCMDRSGSFLDIGCANGYLLECCLKWAAERGLCIDPYGLDVSARLVELARKRLPAFAGHFYVGNAWYWNPPFRFDVVRTELVYVPGELEKRFIQRLLSDYLKPGGRLLIANYAEEHPNPEIGLLPGCHPTRRILDRLAELGFRTDQYRDGHDPVKGRKVRIAILTAVSSQ